MGIDSSKFESHADRISSDYSDEIAYRCAISRKYYYIFHKLRQTYPSYFTFEHGDHGKAKELVRRKGSNDLADDLDDLRELRNDSDYDIDSDIEEIDFRTFEYDLENFILDAKSAGVL